MAVGRGVKVAVAVGVGVNVAVAVAVGVGEIRTAAEISIEGGLSIRSVLYAVTAKK